MSVGPVVRDAATAEFFDGTAAGQFLLRRCPAATVSEPQAAQCTTCASTDLGGPRPAVAPRLVSWAVTWGRPPAARPVRTCWSSPSSTKARGGGRSWPALTRPRCRRHPAAARGAAPAAPTASTSQYRSSCAERARRAAAAAGLAEQVAGRVLDRGRRQQHRSAASPSGMKLSWLATRAIRPVKPASTRVVMTPSDTPPVRLVSSATSTRPGGAGRPEQVLERQRGQPAQVEHPAVRPRRRPASGPPAGSSGPRSRMKRSSGRCPIA